MDNIVKGIPLTGNINEKLILGIGRKRIGELTEDVIMLNLGSFIDSEIEWMLYFQSLWEDLLNNYCLHLGVLSLLNSLFQVEVG